jgi:hypothetical protein
MRRTRTQDPKTAANLIALHKAPKAAVIGMRRARARLRHDQLAGDARRLGTSARTLPWLRHAIDACRLRRAVIKAAQPAFALGVGDPT